MRPALRGRSRTLAVRSQVVSVPCMTVGDSSHLACLPHTCLPSHLPPLTHLSPLERRGERPPVGPDQDACGIGVRLSQACMGGERGRIIRQGFAFFAKAEQHGVVAHGMSMWHG